MDRTQFYDGASFLCASGLRGASQAPLRYWAWREGTTVPPCERATVLRHSAGGARPHRTSPRSTVVSVAVGGLIGLSGDTIGRIGARRQAQRARQESLEDAEAARRRALEDESRTAKADRERSAVENILGAYLEHPVMLLNQPPDETAQSVTRICATLGFEQSFLLDNELRLRIAEICYLVDMALSDSVPGYSLPEVAFLSRSETRMLMGPGRGETLCLIPLRDGGRFGNCAPPSKPSGRENY